MLSTLGSGNRWPLEPGIWGMSEVSWRNGAFLLRIEMVCATIVTLGRG